MTSKQAHLLFMCQGQLTTRLENRKLRYIEKKNDYHVLLIILWTKKKWLVKFNLEKWFFYENYSAQSFSKYDQ